MEERYIVSDRGRTYYWIESCDIGAKCLVFLPGLTANHHLFDAQVQYFAKDYTVLVWDAPAHGKSRPYRAFSYAHLAEELKAILDAENIQKAVLVGQSAGGFAAQTFIAKYPDMAEGLAAIGTCPYGPEYYSKSDLFWLKQTKWMLGMFPNGILQRSMAKMCGATDRGRENMLQMLADYEKKELCRLMYLGFAGFIPEIREQKISCPVCLMVGEKDRTGKVRTYNEQWSQKEGYPLHIIKGAAHNANVDRPDEVNRLIEAFIETL